MLVYCTHNWSTAGVDICGGNVGYRIEQVACYGTSLGNTVFAATGNYHFDSLESDDDIGCWDISRDHSRGYQTHLGIPTYFHPRPPQAVPPLVMPLADRDTFSPPDPEFLTEQDRHPFRIKQIPVPLVP